MSIMAFLLVVWALGQCLASGMAQSDNCQAQSNALLNCQASSKGSSRVFSDECFACQEKVLSSSVYDHPCDALLDVILDAYQQCMTECFPPGYECSQLEMGSLACNIVDLRCSAKDDSNGNTSTGGKENNANGGKDNSGSNTPDSSGVLATALPIMATLLLGCIVLLYEMESDIGHAVSYVGV
jgi:hypothetical protein